MSSRPFRRKPPPSQLFANPQSGMRSRRVDTDDFYVNGAANVKEEVVVPTGPLVHTYTSSYVDRPPLRKRSQAYQDFHASSTERVPSFAQGHFDLQHRDLQSAFEMSRDDEMNQEDSEQAQKLLIEIERISTLAHCGHKYECDCESIEAHFSEQMNTFTEKMRDLYDKANDQTREFFIRIMERSRGAISGTAGKTRDVTMDGINYSKGAVNTVLRR